MTARRILPGGNILYRVIGNVFLEFLPLKGKESGRNFQGRSAMKTRIVLEGNSFFEIDEECLEKKERKRKREQEGAGKGKTREENTEST